MLGHPEWAADPQFADQAARQRNEIALNAAVSAAMRAQTADEWQRRFVAAGIPGAKVVDIAEAFEHPHVALRGMLAGFDPGHPIARHVKVAGNPIKFVGAPQAAFEPVPGLGAQTRSVLTRILAMPEERMSILRHERAVWWSERGEILQRPNVV